MNSKRKTRIVKKQSWYYPEYFVPSGEKKFLFLKWSTKERWESFLKDYGDVSLPIFFGSITLAERYIETGMEYEPDEVVWESK